MMRVILAMVAAVGLAGSAQSQTAKGRWVYITQSDGDGGYIVLGDKTTISKSDNNAKIWTTTVYRVPSPEGVKQFIELNEVDCLSRRYRVADRKAYDKTRAPIFSSEALMPWHAASPDSVGEALTNAACRGFERDAATMDDPFKEADFLLRIEAANAATRHR